MSVTKIILLLCTCLTRKLFFIFNIILFPRKSLTQYIEMKSAYSRMSFWQLYLVMFVRKQTLFGKYDQRTIWQEIREKRREKNQILLPMAYGNYDELEIALSILENYDKITRSEKLINFLFLLIFDEGRSVASGNHGIASSLALSLLTHGKWRLYYYRRACRQFKNFLIDDLYNEGSTHYHTFTVALFKLYYQVLNRKLPEIMTRCNNRDAQKFLVGDSFEYGDFDGDISFLRTILPYPTRHKQKTFNLRSIKIASNFGLLVDQSMYGHGHSHNLFGSLYSISAPAFFTNVPNITYTKSQRFRNINRYLSNFPSPSTVLDNSGYFRPLKLQRELFECDKFVRITDPAGIVRILNKETNTVKDYTTVPSISWFCVPRDFTLKTTDNITKFRFERHGLHIKLVDVLFELISLHSVYHNEDFLTLKILFNQNSKSKWTLS